MTSYLVSMQNLLSTMGHAIKHGDTFLEISGRLSGSMQGVYGYLVSKTSHRIQTFKVSYGIKEIVRSPKSSNVELG